jgi:hypothetical protein
MKHPKQFHVLLLGRAHATRCAILMNWFLPQPLTPRPISKAWEKCLLVFQCLEKVTLPVSNLWERGLPA